MNETEVQSEDHTPARSGWLPWIVIGVVLIVLFSGVAVVLYLGLQNQTEKPREVDERQLAMTGSLQELKDKVSPNAAMADQLKFPRLQDDYAHLYVEAQARIEASQYPEAEKLMDQIRAYQLIELSLEQYWIGLHKGADPDAVEIAQVDDWLEEYPEHEYLKAYRAVFVSIAVDRLTDQNNLRSAVMLLDEQLKLTPENKELAQKLSSIQMRISTRASLAKAMEQAKEAMLDKRYQDAEAAAINALKINPDLDEAKQIARDARSAYQRQEALVALEKRAASVGKEHIDELIRDYQAFVKLNPDMLEAGETLKNLTTRRDRLDTFYASIVSAREAEASNDLINAIRFLDMALEIDPAYKPALEARSRIVDKLEVDKLLLEAVRAKTLGNHSQAMQKINALLALQPDHEQALRIKRELTEAE